MFIGHALLAFALAALVADWRGCPVRRALVVGVVAGAFAAVPDADVAYALVGLGAWGFDGGVLEASTAFWGASTVVHRTVTHSLVVALVAGPAFGLWTVRGRGRRARAYRALGAVALGGLVATAYAATGPLAAFVMGLFVLLGLAVAVVAREYAALSARTVALAAAFGLFSHPWGDLLTGEPPHLLYPLEARLFDSHVALHPDPTLHLLGAFALELAVVWLAALTVLRLTGRSSRSLIGRRASAGGAYGLAAVVLAPPTLEVSYHFVFSILAIGLLCGVAPRRPSTALAAARREFAETDPALRFVLTSLTAITAALVCYVVVYALVVAPSA